MHSPSRCPGHSPSVAHDVRPALGWCSVKIQQTSETTSSSASTYPREGTKPLGLLFAPPPSTLLSLLSNFLYPQTTESTTSFCRIIFAQPRRSSGGAQSFVSISLSSPITPAVLSSVRSLGPLHSWLPRAQSPVTSNPTAACACMWYGWHLITTNVIILTFTFSLALYNHRH
jgi:hypothetical protein